jgi:tetratricopeptide (TPR) repeat protein
MRVSYILVVVVVVLVIFGFRVLVGRYFTLEGRTLSAVGVMDKASKRYDDAAAALSALLDVKLQPGDPISQTLLTACSRWNATIGAHVSPGDPIQQSMKEARDKFTAADSALSLARDRVQTLTGPDPYGLHVVRNDPAGAASAYQLAYQLAYQSAAKSGAPLTVGRLAARNGDIARAAAAFQAAIDSGHAHQGPAAAVELGLLRAENGDPAGAAEVYQLAIDSGHAHHAPAAAVNLGLLREEQGDTRTLDIAIAVRSP